MKIFAWGGGKFVDGGESSGLCGGTLGRDECSFSSFAKNGIGGPRRGPGGAALLDGKGGLFAGGGRDFPRAKTRRRKEGGRFMAKGWAVAGDWQFFRPCQSCGEGFTFIGEGFTFIGEHFTFIGERFTFIGERFTFIGDGFTFIGEHKCLWFLRKISQFSLKMLLFRRKTLVF